MSLSLTLSLQFMTAEKPDPPPSSVSRHNPEAHPGETAPDPTGRRRFMRTNVSLPVELHHAGADVEGQTENLSPGGVFVRTTLACAEGETIELSIQLPNSAHITAHGTVRWVRAAQGASVPAGLGIEFVDLQSHGALSHH